jgi:hypothetical protein
MSARSDYFENLLLDAQAACGRADVPPSGELLAGLVIADAINGLRKAVVHGVETNVEIKLQEIQR